MTTHQSKNLWTMLLVYEYKVLQPLNLSEEILVGRESPSHYSWMITLFRNVKGRARFKLNMAKYLIAMKCVYVHV